MENTRNRTQISREQIVKGVGELTTWLHDRLEKKGYGTMASRHEILGVIIEEMRELEDACRDQLDSEVVALELLDLAVGALFGYICIREGTVDW